MSKIEVDFGKSRKQRVRSVPNPPPDPEVRSGKLGPSWFLLTTTFLFAGLFVWSEFFSGPSGTATPEVLQVTPRQAVEKYLNIYREGMANLYADAAVKAMETDADGRPVFRDAVAALEFIESHKREIEDRAGEDMVAAFASINGEGWSPERAADVFQGFSEGYSQ